jgi:hypothetical protein
MNERASITLALFDEIDTDFPGDYVGTLKPLRADRRDEDRTELEGPTRTERGITIPVRLSRPG